MTGHGRAVCGKHELTPRRRHLVCQGFDRSPSLSVDSAHHADVDGGDSARIVAYDLGIHFRVALTTIANQNKREPIIERQHVANEIVLVILGSPRQRML
jgi:hypothetical protein